MIVGPKRVLFMDEISTGLDSSTTFEIVKYLHDATHALQYTTAIALLQPAPEVYDLFDDVLLLAEGERGWIWCSPHACARASTLWPGGWDAWPGPCS